MSHPPPVLRPSLLQIFPVVAVLIGCLPGCDASRSPRFPRPVVVVTVDGLREDLLAQACDRGELPALAALRDRSLQYRQCRAACPSSAASHATLWTGLPPSEHGVRLDRLFRLDERFVTIAERRTRQGDTTAAFVSADPMSRSSGLLRGFQVVDAPLSEHLVMYLEGEHADFGTLSRPLETTAARAEQWRSTAPADSFLWVHLQVSGHDASGREPTQVYGERLRALDQALAPLLNATLPREGSPAVVVALVGSVGELHGEHGRFDTSRSLADEALHVPLWISGDDTPPAVIDTPVGLDALHRHLLRASGLGAVEPASTEQRLEALAAFLEGGNPQVRGVADGELVSWYDGRVWQRDASGVTRELTEPAEQRSVLDRIFAAPPAFLAPRVVTSPEVERRLTMTQTVTAPGPADDTWRRHASAIEKRLVGRRGLRGPSPEDLWAWHERSPDDARILEMWLQSSIDRQDDEDPRDEFSERIGEAVGRLPHSAYLSALASQPRYHRASPEEFIRHGEQALATAPWYFPAVRGIASALLLDRSAADARLRRFAEEAPLSDTARQELAQRMRRSRASLENDLDDG